MIIFVVIIGGGFFGFIGMIFVFFIMVIIRIYYNKLFLRFKEKNVEFVKKE